jgi:uncharacterized protein (DUF885 family)
MTWSRWPLVALFLVGANWAQPPGEKPAQAKELQVPDLTALAKPPPSEMRVVLKRYDADRGSLQRFYTILSSPTRQERLHRFNQGWSKALQKLPVEKLSAEGRADFEILRKKIDGELQQLDEDAKAFAEVGPLLPFARTITALAESRQQMDKVDVAQAAGLLNNMKKQLGRLSAALTTPAGADDKAVNFKLTKSVASRAADTTSQLRSALKRWFAFYNGYEPTFAWWTADLYKDVDQALEDYAAVLRKSEQEKTVRLQPMPGGEPVPLGDPSNPRPPFLAAKASDVPDLAALLEFRGSELIEVVAQYQNDRASFGRFGGAFTRLPKTPEGQAKLKKLCTDWLAALAKLDFDKLSLEGRVDYLLLQNRIQSDLRRLDLQAKASEEPARKPGGAGPKDPSGIVGHPIGRAALLVELAAEMIPYTPEELLAVADKEFAWCEAEMKKAAREMGCGDDWLKAVEKVKTRHVPPGKQPELIRDLAWEANAYLLKHDLVTVPPLAQETWRMEMMSPERQLINPFFTGGEVISVSFPTSSMSYEAKLQSMRGNNIHFARATVHHELIPGHHLQGFMTARYNNHRRAFGTPFWVEGWALYWEMLLYERGFPKSAEDRIGFLFWRMHRCARITFSLNFHLEKMTPQECIDYLVNRVGHERDNATAEVRRSFASGAGPLYQAAYMLGGLQFRALHKELVQSGKMTNREFHDAVLKENSIPVEMVRALLTNQQLGRDFRSQWKFCGP